MELIERIFRKRPISQSKLYRDIVKPTRCEAPIEVPQTRHNHPDNGYLDVGACLIKDEKIEALALGGAHASHNLLPPIEAAESWLGIRSNWRFAFRYQIRMVRQPQFTFVTAKLRITTSHETDGEKLT